VVEFLSSRIFAPGFWPQTDRKLIDRKFVASLLTFVTVSVTYCSEPRPFLLFFQKREGQAVQAVRNAAGIAKSVVGFGRLGADTPTAMDGSRLMLVRRKFRWQRLP
jgi:hypothetical protein